MKEQRKRLAKAVVLLLIAAGFAMSAIYLTMGANLPTDFKDLNERAQYALEYAHSHGYSENYALFLDYSIPSGEPRMFVWDFNQGKIVARTYAMHGPGKGSTKRHPVFSDRPGSKCSTLGMFKVTKEHGTKIRRSFRLKGLERRNKNAYSRGLMIHPATRVNKYGGKVNYIPLDKTACSGCVSTSSSGMDYIIELVNKEDKSLLLWNFC